MKKIFVAAAALALASGAALAANPFEGFKGHMKPGMYEYKMESQMSGMPANMGSHNMTIKRCITEKDLDNGNFSKSERQPTDCEFTDVNKSANGVSYKMVCKGKTAMTGEGKVSVRNDGFVSDMKMNMAQGPAGQPMTMNQHVEGKYIGACDK